MLQLHSKTLDVGGGADSMRQPLDSDDFANELYVQDLIARSAAKVPSRFGERTYARCATIWQFITRVVGWRLG